MLTNNKQLYQNFCKETYVPIYSQIWWMDAVCGKASWDVWLYKKGKSVLAAMPYYFEKRGKFKYITKAPLTQNNGIIFKEDRTRKRVNQAKFEEEVISAACEYIESLQLDVYEQQYQTSFKNWSPFLWHNYSCLLRYTYVIEDTSDMGLIKSRFTHDLKRNIQRGQDKTFVTNEIDQKEFYKFHELVFKKQGLECPFTEELWENLYYSVKENNAGDTFCAKDSEGNIHALLFLIWDDRTVYHLLGGSVPEYTTSQAYASLTYFGIRQAHEMGKKYDFEGSMIERIAKSFRRWGGEPMPYYRIRRVFNPEVIDIETKNLIENVKKEKSVNKASR